MTRKRERSGGETVRERKKGRRGGGLQNKKEGRGCGMGGKK